MGPSKRASRSDFFIGVLRWDGELDQAAARWSSARRLLPSAAISAGKPAGLGAVVPMAPIAPRAPAPVGRTRVFNYQDRARLSLIQRLRRLGFSIDAIREYL